MTDFIEGHRYQGNPDPTGAIYLVLDNQLRHIYNPEVYVALFGDGTWKYEKVAISAIDGKVKGASLNQVVGLVKGSGDLVYLIDNGKKRWIKNPDTFNKYGFSWDKIVVINDPALKRIPDGATIG